MQPTLPDQHSIRDLVLEAQRVLAAGPHPDRARIDAETLLLHILQQHNPGQNRARLLTHLDSTAEAHSTAEFHALIERRLSGEPIQHILGEAEFYGLPFFVNRDVLIPRPETEHLVEKALQLAANFTNPRIVDVGTGSGAIAVALAAHLPGASITATDLSPSALAVAKHNAARNGVKDRVRFLAGDSLAPIAHESFEIIASNPPYVPETDRPSLAVEVRDYEPAVALFAGEDGLAIYRRLVPAAFTALTRGGFLALEIGCGQQSAVSAILQAAGFRNIQFTSDLQGIPRVASARRP